MSDNGKLQPAAIDLSAAHICIPTHSGLVHSSMMMSVLQFSSGESGWTGGPKITAETDSLLCRCFNKLLMRAIVGGAEWFIMLHADISAEPGWLVKLLRIAEEERADILSVLQPIKSPLGLTSTGIDLEPTDGSDHVAKFRRLTMAEVAQLPDTFTHRDVAKLLDIHTPRTLRLGDATVDVPLGECVYGMFVNTGLMAVRLGEWVLDFPGFRIHDRIEWTREGDRIKGNVSVMPEDWNLSRWANTNGLKVVCTKAIECNHHGAMAYGNQGAWGEWQTDHGEHCGIELAEQMESR